MAFFLAQFYAPFADAIDTLNFTGCALSDAAIDALARSLRALHDAGHVLPVRVLNLSGRTAGEVRSRERNHGQQHRESAGRVRAAAVAA